MYQSEASGRGALCSFIRSHQSCIAAGIAVLLSLVAVGLAPLMFINKEVNTLVAPLVFECLLCYLFITFIILKYVIEYPVKRL